MMSGRAILKSSWKSGYLIIIHNEEVDQEIEYHLIPPLSVSSGQTGSSGG